MENNQKEQEEAVSQIYEYAARLLFEENKSSYEVINILVQEGLNIEIATTVVKTLETQAEESKKERANKDMLYGALWFIGGSVATISDVGYVFWGAIVFGAFQFIKGAVNIFK
jgi:hypothetical protein